MEQFYTILWSAVGIILTGLASWLTATGVSFLNQKIKDKKIARWASEVFQIIMNAVQTVFQTYVEELKEKGKFGEEEAKKAKERAYKIITSQLTDELKSYITENFGDMKEYIMNQIEAQIYMLKK